MSPPPPPNTHYYYNFGCTTHTPASKHQNLVTFTLESDNAHNNRATLCSFSGVCRLSNSEVIRVNQDVLGKQGERLAGGPLTGQAYLSECNAGNPAQRFRIGGAGHLTSLLN
jgi:hypothetical protein